MKEKKISEQEIRRKRVYNFYLANRSQGKIFTLNHFLTENMSKATIYRIINRAENESGHERINGSGRIAKIMTEKRVNHLKSMFDHKDNISQRQAARKFKCSQPFICYTLRRKTSIKKRKKIKIPERTEAQKLVNKTKCGRLYKKLLENLCILDDESYFTLKHTNINGNDNFYTSDVSKTPSNVKFKSVAKFEKKLLVWICFSEKGISRPFFVPSGLAVNQNVYLEEMIKKRLMPFIQEYHSDGKYIFWPDLASSHYAKSVTTYLNDKKVNFLAKSDNPANMPEIRPVEKFWGILKGKVYENNWQAQTIEELKSRVVYCLKKISLNLVQTLSRQTKGLVDKVRRNGLIENSN